MSVKEFFCLQIFNKKTVNFAIFNVNCWLLVNDAELANVIEMATFIAKALFFQIKLENMVDWVDEMERW